MNRRTRMLSGLCVSLGVLAGLAAPAAAHVTVNPREATKGSYAKLAFRTPNERPDSPTTKLEVVFPADTPFQSVSVRPTPGWKVAVEKVALSTPITREGRDALTEVTSKVTWTGGAVNPGEFEEFEVSVGPLPKEGDQLVFKALQTYASGEVVSWIEEAVTGGDEPEHPAPVLKLVSAPSTATPGASATPVSAATAAAETPDSDGDSAKGLAVAALALGAVGLAVGIAALARRRSPVAGSPS